MLGIAFAPRFFAGVKNTAVNMVELFQERLQVNQALQIGSGLIGFFTAHPAKIICMDIAKAIRLPKGRYVIAVSGGVDSMVLLDILRQRPELKLTVAHFDHGIRRDTDQDRRLIQDVARRHGLPFVYDHGSLGPGASEATARKARYEFLHRVRAQAGADGIITAHHLDDAVETAVHNLLRGTGRKGMSSLHNETLGVYRPMLHLSKQHLINYARKNDVHWREDSTNNDLRYKRNHIRHKLLPNLRQRSPKDYDKLVRLIKRNVELNRAIDEQLTHLLHVQPKASSLDRHLFIMLPHDMSSELVAHWLRVCGAGQFNKRHIAKLVRGLKVGQQGSIHVIDPSRQFHIGKNTINLHSVQ